MRAAVFFLLLLSFTVHAKQRFVVGVQDISYFPHYDFRQQDKGVIWAILEAFSEKTGYQFDYVGYPIKRLNREMMDGQIDFVFPENPKWYNQQVPENIKTYSASVYKAMGASFILRRHQHLQREDISRLVIPRGFSPVMWREQVESGTTVLIEVSDSHASLNLLLKERAQVADLEYAVVEHLRHTHPEYQDVMLAPHLPYDIVDFHIATIAHKEVIDSFNLFLQTEHTYIKDLLTQYHIVPHAELK